MRRYRKTQKKSKKYVKRKTQYRRRRGGVNNNNEESFEARADNLIGITQFIIESIDQMREEDPNIDEEFFVNEIRAFEPEADAIDAHFGNHEMEDMLNLRIEQVMEAFDLIVHNNNNNNQTIVANMNMNNSHMNSNTNSVISVYNAKNGKKLKRK
jgi:predicted lipid-binding transport protein (Tim44 family)